MITFMAAGNSRVFRSSSLRSANKRTLGHETTAVSLVWATYALSIYHDVADYLRKEVKDLLATKPNPDYSDLEGLSYLEKFTKELFRFLSSGKHPECSYTFND